MTLTIRRPRRGTIHCGREQRQHTVPLVVARVGTIPDVEDEGSAAETVVFVVDMRHAFDLTVVAVALARGAVDVWA